MTASRFDAFADFGPDEPLDERALAREKTIDQGVEALQSMRNDYTRAPRLPWDSVDTVVGPVLPGTWWVLGAYTGRGKTTTMMSLLADLAERGRRVTVFALEMKPPLMRRVWASVALGYKTSYVIENRWRELPVGAFEAVEKHVNWQVADMGEFIRFADEEYLDAANLPRLMKREANLGAELVLIDHIHRCADASYQGVSLAAKAISAACRDSNVPVIATAQFGQGADRDPLKPYLPPQLEDLYLSGVIAQECWVALGLYHPLGSHSKADLDAVRRREREPHTLAIPGTIGVRCMKHRVRGTDAVGQIRQLTYKDGKILDPETQRRESIEELESDYTRVPPEPIQDDMWEDGRE